MRKSILKYALLSVYVALFFALILFTPQANSSAETLLNAIDYISSNYPSDTDVHHHFGFEIPASGTAISPTDYITIEMTNYLDLTVPTSGTGWSGSPIYSIDGNKIQITGVTIPKETRVAIAGITATNPSTGLSDGIKITTSSDAAQTTIYDSVNITPTIIKESVGASVSIIKTGDIILSGYTAPGSFVTIWHEGVAVGTAVADENGYFMKELSGLDTALEYTFNVSSTAPDGKTSSTSTFNIPVDPDVTLEISNITLPPTIKISKVSVEAQQFEVVSGMGPPNSQVVITIYSSSGASQEFIVYTDDSGNWNHVFIPQEVGMDIGTYSVDAFVLIDGGYRSDRTPKLIFDVTECSSCDDEEQLEEEQVISPPTVISNETVDGGWTNSESITLFWNQPEGATGYLYQISTSPDLSETGFNPISGNTLTFDDLAEGIYYFTVIATDGDRESLPTTFVIKIDRTPPRVLESQEPNSLSYILDQQVIDYLPTLDFGGFDNLTENVTYEISVNGGEYILVTSPYDFRDLGIITGINDISIRITDAAGNSTVKTFRIALPDIDTIIVRELEYTDGNILKITGTADPNSTIIVYLNGEAIAEIPVNADGTFTYELSDLPYDANCELTLQQRVDKSENESVRGIISRDEIVIPCRNVPVSLGTINGLFESIISSTIRHSIILLVLPMIIVELKRLTSSRSRKANRQNLSPK